MASRIDSWPVLILEIVAGKTEVIINGIFAEQSIKITQLKAGSDEIHL